MPAMCNERERLIGYVYDECDAAERSAVRQHLEACAECRAEIEALRSVRQDLQAWDVPDHESVWKPFVPVPAPAWWQQVPRWAMAAAAGAVIVSGATGGAVAIAMMPQTPGPVVATSAAAGATQVSLSPDDLAALERRIEARLQAEVSALNGRVLLASSRTPVSTTEPSVIQNDFSRQLSELRAMNDQQLEAINRMYANMTGYRREFDIKHALLKQTVGNLATVVEQTQGR